MKFRIYIPYDELQRAAREARAKREANGIESVEDARPVIAPGHTLMETDDGYLDVFVCLNDYYVRLMLEGYWRDQYPTPTDEGLVS